MPFPKVAFKVCLSFIWSCDDLVCIWIHSRKLQNLVPRIGCSIPWHLYKRNFILINWCTGLWKSQFVFNIFFNWWEVTSFWNTNLKYLGVIPHRVLYLKFCWFWKSSIVFISYKSLKRWHFISNHRCKQILWSLNTKFNFL